MSSTLQYSLPSHYSLTRLWLISNIRGKQWALFGSILLVESNASLTLSLGSPRHLVLKWTWVLPGETMRSSCNCAEVPPLMELCLPSSLMFARPNFLTCTLVCPFQTWNFSECKTSGRENLYQMCIGIVGYLCFSALFLYSLNYSPGECVSFIIRKINNCIFTMKTG